MRKKYLRLLLRRLPRERALAVNFVVRLQPRRHVALALDVVRIRNASEMRLREHNAFLQPVDRRVLLVLLEHGARRGRGRELLWAVGARVFELVKQMLELWELFVSDACVVRETRSRRPCTVAAHASRFVSGPVSFMNGSSLRTVAMMLVSS